MADLAICYLIMGMIIATGIAVLYPRNVKTKIMGYEFKSQIGAKIAAFLVTVLVWPALILFGEFTHGHVED